MIRAIFILRAVQTQLLHREGEGLSGRGKSLPDDGQGTASPLGVMTAKFIREA
jgi:hypothetical protein